MKNKCEIRGDLTAIFVKYKGVTYECLIDTEDLNVVSSFKGTWYLSNNGYICITESWSENGKSYVRKLIHRVVTRCPDDMVVDHINFNKLNNTSENLRIVTRAQNNQNRNDLTLSNKSGVRGVSWDSKQKRWCARYQIDGICHNVGYFDDIKTAEKAIRYARSKNMPYSQEALDNSLSYNKKTDLNNENRMNKSCGIRGVTWSKYHKKWTVVVRINGKQKHIGRYSDLHEAAQIATELIKQYEKKSS